MGIAALAVLGVAVAGRVVHRSAPASGDVAVTSDDEFEDPANVATSIADHENLSDGGITQDVNRKTTREKMFLGLFFKNLIMLQTSSVLIWRQRLKKNLQHLGKDSSSMLW